VKRKKFREDLYFRLNVVAIHLPPLRERREDIQLLADYFLRKYTERIKKSIRGFSEESMDFLGRYSYPGNVRQLENIIERAVIFTKGDTIMPDVLREPATFPSTDSGRMPVVSPNFARSRTHVLKVFEKQFLHQQLKKHRGNVTAAAEESNMTRQNFQRLMKKYKIKSNNFR
jgi:transcriptional regulator with PAS, ATPase and Fis domain